MGKFCEKLTAQDYLILEILGMEEELKNLPPYTEDDQEEDFNSQNALLNNDVVHIKSDADENDDDEVQVQKYEMQENYTNGFQVNYNEVSSDSNNEEINFNYKHNGRRSMFFDFYIHTFTYIY